MKLPHPNKGNLSPPDPEKLELMQQVSMDMLQGETGALIWTESEGYQFRVKTDDEHVLPPSLYMLFLCYLRLCEDDNFGNELLAWAKRNQN